MKFFKKIDNSLVTILAVGLVLVALVLAFSSKPRINVSGGQIQEDTITVSGQAEMSVDPDQAELYAEIETTKETAKQAKDENSQTSEAVENALRKKGVGRDDIETSRYNIRPKYEYDPDTRESFITGYIVTNVLKVTTGDMENVGELIDAAVDAGANGFERILFGLSDEKQKDVNAAVLLKASDEAEAKAESLTKNLGVKLGKLSSISESNFYYAPYAYPAAEMEEAVLGGARAAVSISPQKVDVRATVSLAYEIE
ncbi:SIMPL domain-containing protein [Candidatus Woesearchaeota archaeon]|nr:SIMPL domain-containing protein [Candidatus Woesearchaeota archaeon]